jgi:GNAT superfamily N-acetyltransferase
MTPHDAEPAAGLSGELGYPVDCDVMRARIARIAARPDHAVFVACRGPFVVGWIHVAAVEHLQSEPRAEIGGLVVTAEARSSGVGALLVTRAEEWAREHGLGGVIVRSQVMREAAHRFYLREGFERTKTSAVFSKML